jgi:hypothetical protein
MKNLFSFSDFIMCSVCTTYVLNASPNNSIRGAQICTKDGLDFGPASQSNLLKWRRKYKAGHQPRSAYNKLFLCFFSNGATRLATCYSIISLFNSFISFPIIFVSKSLLDEILINGNANDFKYIKFRSFAFFQPLTCGSNLQISPL